MSISLLQPAFQFDALSKIMSILVVFIGGIVGMFSCRYMQGDSHYYKFLGLLALLILSLVTMVTAGNLVILLVLWGTSNYLLLRLMVHESHWRAAKASGKLAAKTFCFGFLCLAFAFGLLYFQTRNISLQVILSSADTRNPVVIMALILIMITVMTQSGIWPFHRWLTSSLNSPTPVSAIMHAGLVNGGGFLIARFASLYVEQPKIMTIIFILGAATALIGTLWKLMQHDIKRMLACSTMGQMGFMLAQCGLGLFPAAIAHLCWHGLFKAHLFLTANNVAKEKRLKTDYPPRFLPFMFALLCGILGSYTFSITSHKMWQLHDTNFILLCLVCITGTQFALTLLKIPAWKNLLVASVLTGLIGALYGKSIFIIEWLLAPLHISLAQPLNIYHFIGLFLLTLAWLGMLFNQALLKRFHLHPLLIKLYVKTLNASQPHPDTITTHRNHYQSH
jgi:NAD(P)H-quinone oxidoreductase subunit 5